MNEDTIKKHWNGLKEDLTIIDDNGNPFILKDVPMLQNKRTGEKAVRLSDIIAAEKAAGISHEDCNCRH